MKTNLTFDIDRWVRENSVKANPWLMTKYAIYPTLTNKKKGALGESIVRDILKKKYGIITYNSYDVAWDCQTDSIRIEIKTSFENTNNGDLTGKYMFNHISVKKTGID